MIAYNSTTEKDNNSFHQKLSTTNVTITLTTRAVLNIRFMFALAPNSGSNS